MPADFGAVSNPEIDIDLSTVETNIVRFRLKGISAAQFVDEAHRLGVHMLPSGPNARPSGFFVWTLHSDVERAYQAEENHISVSA